MIRVVSKSLDKEDCNALARIIVSSRKNTPLETSAGIDVVSNEIEKIATDDSTKILTALDDESNMVVWISYYIGFPLMAFIEGFMPVVDEDCDSEEIAMTLIEATKRKAIESGHSRLEIVLDFPTDKHRKYSENLLEWYRKSGFDFAAEEAHMTLDLDQIELPKISPPEGYILRSFSTFGYEMLENAGFQTFRDSRDDLFLSLNDAEQKVTMRHFFSKSKPFIEKASPILEKKGQVVGFAITRLTNNKAEIGPVGLVPEERGKGLANYLFVNALEGVKDAGINTACLDVSIANHPARKLYEKYGFKKAFSKQFYYWTS